MAVEKHGENREKLFYPNLWKEQLKSGWFGSRKKKNPETTRVTDFSMAEAVDSNHCTEQGVQCR